MDILHKMEESERAKFITHDTSILRRPLSPPHPHSPPCPFSHPFGKHICISKINLCYNQPGYAEII